MVRRSPAASAPGSSRASTTRGRVGAASRSVRARSVASPTAASMAARSRGSSSRPRQATASDAVSATRRRWVPCSRSGPGPVCSSSVSSGLSRTAPPGRSADRHHPPRLGQRTVLALRVHHPGAAPEHGLAPQVGLDERALAPADLSEHHHVGIGDHPLPVEGERVVDERAPEEVPTDEHALVTEAGLAHQRIGRAQVTGGGHVGRDPGVGQGHDSPRPNGSEQAKATACSP